MLDDLRNSASHSFIEDFPEEKEKKKRKPDGPRLFLGMTARQRFLVSLLLLIMTCAIGTRVLVACGKVYI